MHDDLLKILKRLVDDEDKSDETIAKTWIQVGTLDPDEVAQQRGLRSDSDLTDREVDLLKSKILALTAMFNVKRDEFWSGLYKRHGLPKADYHINDDGRIFMRPKSNASGQTEKP